MDIRFSTECLFMRSKLSQSSAGALFYKIMLHIESSAKFKRPDFHAVGFTVLGQSWHMWKDMQKDLQIGITLYSHEFIHRTVASHEKICPNRYQALDNFQKFVNAVFPALSSRDKSPLSQADSSDRLWHKQVLEDACTAWRI